MKFTTLGFLVLCVFLPACSGGDGSADASEPQVEEGMDTEHRLSITVDGTRLEASGHPFGPAVHFGGREINIQVGGPLASAIAANKSVSLGDFDLKANVLANGVEPGAYELVGNQNNVTRSEERKGFMEFFLPESEPFQHLRPVSGTLTIETVKGKEEQKRYRLERVTGRIEGQFMDKAFTEHRVEGTFEYVR
ncbi:hypothetical protein Poly30_52560 [Planctomycetes bacterium Poly30]|uniref:Lipoprotein n=1 Tax=Saltatorellus ferox TaxID=2528018 RepID=A0A518F035_9BACT|nr:hypothetical protein Poly30_52560 [Planctomycetes bacterium Poly30]